MATDIAAVNQVTITAKDETGAAFASVASNLTALVTQFGGAASLIKGALGAVGVGSFVTAISGAIELQAQLGQLAARAGITVEALTSMRFAAHEGGLTLEEVAIGSARLSKALFEAEDGTTKAAKALAALGLDAKELSFLGPAEQMKALADRLAQFQDGGTKTAIVMELLGRSGAQFQAFLKALAQDGAAAAQVTTEQAEAAKQAEAAFARLADNSLKLKIALANELLPTIVDITDALIKMQEGSTISEKAAALLTEDLSLAGKALRVLFAPQIAAAVLVYGDGIDRSAQSTKNWGGETARARDSLASLEGVVNAVTVDLDKLNTVISSIESKDLGIGSGFAASFKVLTDALNAGSISLERYQALTKQLLGQQPFAEKQAAAAKALEEEHQRLLQSTQDYIDAAIDEAATMNLDTVALMRHKDALALLSKAQSEVLVDERLRAIDISNQLKAANEQLVKGWQAYDAAMAKLQSDQDSYIDSLISEVDALKIESATIGLSNAERQIYIATQDLAKASAEGNATAVAFLTEKLRLLGEVESKSVAFQAVKDQAKAVQEAWKQTATTIEDAMVSAFEGVLTKGKDLFQQLKDFAIKLFEQLVLRPILAPIAGSIASSIFPGAAGASGLGGGGIGGAFQLGNVFGGEGNLFSNFTSGLQGIGSGLSNFFAAIGNGTGLLDSATSAFGGLGASISQMLPGIGILAAIGIPLLSSLFKSGGGPKEGGSATLGDVSAITALGSGNAGAGRFFTPNSADAAVADTIKNVNAQFSTILTALGGKAFNVGFALGFDTDPKGTAQSRVSGGVSVGGQQVFSQQNLDVGRDDASLQAGLALEAQRAVLAALKASDLPADIAKLFSGLDVGTLSADQITAVEKTAATYKAINDAIASLPADIQQHFTDMLDGTQQLANSILVVVGVIQTFSGAVAGLGPKLEALDPASITAFVDALGGAQAAAASFSFLAANFLTSTQKMDLATATLNADFANLGITTIPQTHQAFLDLLNSFDLTTDAGRQMYAGVLALSQLFVTVHGTADDAAGALGSVSDSLKAISDAQGFFDANFYSDAERAAAKLASEQQQVNAAQTALGVAIPQTVSGFRQLIESIDQTTPAGKAMYAALIVLAPAIFDIATASKTAADQITAAASAISNAGAGLDVAQTAADKFVSKFEAKITALANLSTGDLGSKLGIQIPLYTAQIGQLQTQLADYLQSTGGNIDIFAVQLQTEIESLSNANDQMVQKLAEFTTLKAQYGSAIAEQLIALEETYNQQQRALHGNADALAALQTIYQQNWQDIINGVASGVDGTLSQLDKLRQGIQDYLDSLKVSELSPLTPQQKLAEALSQLNAEAARAATGDQGALGDVTKFADAYLQLDRQINASGQAFTDAYNYVVGLLQPLTQAGTFTDVAVPGSPTPTGTPPPTSTPPTTTVTGKGGKQLATTDDLTATATLLTKLHTDVLGVQSQLATLTAAVESGSNKNVAVVERSANKIVDGVKSRTK